MGWTAWMIFYLVINLIHGILTWKLYVRAGKPAWTAFVPIVNMVVLLKIVSRPVWWVVLLHLPVVNLIMLPVMWIETARSFGHLGTLPTWLTVLTLGVYNGYIAYGTDSPHRPERSLKPKGGINDLISSLAFAIVAATIVHTYVMQPFIIPTSSLEKTLLVGDFLFVSKVHYGPRVPTTPLALPMMHDTIFGTRTKSYIDKPQLPYTRLPGFSSVKRNDIVVFGWPIDTTTNGLISRNGKPGVRKPLDKKTNYVKRAVGIPGDVLEIVDGVLMVNGAKSEMPERARLQFSYEGELNSQFSNQQEVKRIQTILYERFDITDPISPVIENGMYSSSKLIMPALTEEAAATLRESGMFKTLEKRIQPAGKLTGRSQGLGMGRAIRTFPETPRHPWNVDNFGPITIPAEGVTMPLNPDNAHIYKYLIEVYEGYEIGLNNKLTINNDGVFLNGNAIDSYTFKQDYYWMMGDNRHNSQDARSWGFVPFSHVIGKPVMVWLSFDINSQSKGMFEKARWERFFTTIDGTGEPVSYRWLVLGLIIAYFVGNYLWARRKERGA